MILKSIARDPLFWIVALVCLTAVGATQLLFTAAPGSEGNAPLAGSPEMPVRHDDPLVYAVMNGVFPKVDPSLTLHKAFARYRWFAAEPKWIGQGRPPARKVIVSAPLRLPKEAVRLGMGSNAAQVIYVAEFGFTADMSSFKPLSSAVEVRDASNKLVALVPDPEFILVRRVMRGVEPGVSLPGGVARGK